jgi:hypothetical protein
MKPKSPRKEANHVLGVMSAKRIKTFLEDCVNLPNRIDYPPENALHFERWLKRWRGLFTYRDQDEEGNSVILPVPREHLGLFAPVVRTTLCRLWGEPDARQRDWYCYRLRDAHRQMVRHLEGWNADAVWGSRNTIQRLMDYAMQEVPAVSTFEAAIFWAQEKQPLMLRCAAPTCPTPYFFRSEKGQKFCSPECADSARREAKLRWWNESPNSPKNRNRGKQ